MKKIEFVSYGNLRDYFPREDLDFTPWLAQEENITKLGDLIDIPQLELLSTEEPVGPYRADILCVDSMTGNNVVIENQLEKSDHSHIGQLLTYCSNLKAPIGIWIAQKLTTEHINTLNWLNEITGNNYGFYGIEVQIHKTGKGEGIYFNTIVKPENITKISKVITCKNSELQNNRSIFWNEFKQYLSNNSSILEKEINFDNGHNKCVWITMVRCRHWLNIILYEKENKVELQLKTCGDEDKKYFDAIFANKDDAEQKISNEIIWERQDELKTSIIKLGTKCDFNDKESWYNEVFPWIVKYTELFISYFRPIIQQLY